MTEYTTFTYYLFSHELGSDVLCFLAYLHWSVCVVGHCCFCISHFLETAVPRTYPNNSLICGCGLAPTLHARGCLARGVLFAGHPVQLHNGFQGWLWEKQFAMTHTGPRDMLDTVYRVYLLPVVGKGASSDYIYHTCGVDCWTWSSWTCDICASALHSLLCYIDVHVLYLEKAFFRLSTMLMLQLLSPPSACHTARSCILLT